jgi:hypothetical protein
VLVLIISDIFHSLGNSSRKSKNQKNIKLLLTMSSPSRLLTPSGEPRALRKKELVAIVTDLESENHILRLRLGLDEIDAGSDDEDTQAASQRRVSEGGGKHEEPEYAKKYHRRKSFAGTYVSGEAKEEGGLAKFQAKENKKVQDFEGPH